MSWIHFLILGFCSSFIRASFLFSKYSKYLYKLNFILITVLDFSNIFLHSKMKKMIKNQSFLSFAWSVFEFHEHKKTVSIHTLETRRKQTVIYILSFNQFFCIVYFTKIDFYIPRAHNKIYGSKDLRSVIRPKRYINCPVCTSTHPHR